MRKIKNGLILAGGDSSRFWPLQEKSFFSFLGKPLVLYQIEELTRYCDKVTIIANKKNAISIDRLIENSDFQSKTQVIVQNENLEGQAGAVLSAKNHLKGEVVIINANDLIDYSLFAKITAFPLSANKIILVGKKISEYFPGGYFKFNDQKKVISIIEKPDKEKLPSSITKLVVDYFSDFDLLINSLEKTKTEDDDHYERAINSLISDNLDCIVLPYDGYWQSIKYPWHVLMMMKNFLSGIKQNQISKTAVISKNAVIISPVFIGDNVRIGDFSKIVGPVYIGDNTVVGDYAMIRESEINEDCLIGSFTEVARSYIGNKVFLHRNYVGDSILSDKVTIGAQGVTANLRFDGENVSSIVDEEKINTNSVKLGAIIGRETKIGVNTTIIPGIKIGKNCLISPGEVVRCDLEDNTFLVKGEERNNLSI